MRKVRAAAIVEWGLLAALLAAGFGAWGVGIATRTYDHDEVQRAHSVWLAARGLRPYSTLFEVHPPYFALLTPLVGLWGDPCDLLRGLRLFAAAGNLAWLGALAVLAAGTAPEPEPGGRGSRWLWAGLGVACVAFQPRVLDFLVEFRIDGWGYALAAWSVVLLRRRPEARGAYAAFGVLSGVATLLFSPKLAVFSPLVVACALIGRRPGLRSALGLAASYAIGLAGAGAAFALFLLVQGIPLDRTYLLLFRYHTISNAHSAYRHGMVWQILATPWLTAAIGLGLLAAAVEGLRRGRKLDAYLAAVGLWLLLQAPLVSYPYKQYYAPWFLFASVFVVVLGRVLAAIHVGLGVLACVVASGATIVASAGIAQLWRAHDPNRYQCAALRVMNVLATPGDRVVAPPPEHPIVRRDVFFLWFNTSDPRGYDSERILEQLGPYRAEVSFEADRRALEADPPAFVVLGVGTSAPEYPRAQLRALREFLPAQGYHLVRLRTTRRLLLALRHDRYERLRRSGLFEDAPGTLGAGMPFAHGL
jgi:hypothetical protein